METQKKNLKLGTRGSDLALFQSHFVKSLLEKNGFQVELVIVQTRGDKDLRPLKEIAGDGFFTKDLEHMLLTGDIDLAVHSAKDLASMQHQDLCWFAVGERESTRDVIIYNSVSFSSTSKVGTSSPRRKAQYLKTYPEANLVELRGNVPTRLAKVTESDLDAVILAEAGLKRLDLLKDLPQGVSSMFPAWVTAPCQGVLALQTRQELYSQLSCIENTELSQVAHLEKSILAFLGGGCHMAVGAHIERKQESFHFSFFLEESKKTYELDKLYPSLDQLKKDVFADLAKLFCKPNSNTSKHGSICFTHSLSHQKKALILALENGFSPSSLPLIEARSTTSDKTAIEILDKLDNFQNLFFTSQYGVRIFLMQYLQLGYELEKLGSLKIYSIGEATSKKLREFGLSPQETSWKASAKEMTTHLQEKLIQNNNLYIGTEDSLLLKLWQEQGIPHQAYYVYQTKLPQYNLPSLPPRVDAILFASPSSVKNYHELYGANPLEKSKIFSLGPSTAAEVKKQGFSSVESSKIGSWEQLIDDMKSDLENRK